jgi:hypothetical protein
MTATASNCPQPAATSIMNQNVKFNLKVIDDNTIKPTIEEPTSLSLPAA